MTTPTQTPITFLLYNQRNVYIMRLSCPYRRKTSVPVNNNDLRSFCDEKRKPNCTIKIQNNWRRQWEKESSMKASGWTRPFTCLRCRIITGEVQPVLRSDQMILFSHSAFKNRWFHIRRLVGSSILYVNLLH